MGKEIRAEFHVHSRFSKDSLLCLSFIYLKCRLHKIRYIAITDHNNIAGGLAFKRYCEKRKNKVTCIVGEEIMTQSGEIIGLFLNENIPAGLNAEQTIEEIENQNGIVYVPHPFDEKRSKTVLKEDVIAAFRERIDCIECYNGRNFSVNYAVKQMEIAEKYCIPSVIGSDAHTYMELGRNYLCLQEAPLTPEKYRSAILTASFHKKKCIRFAHQITKISKALKMIFRGDFHGLHRAIDKRH